MFKPMLAATLEPPITEEALAKLKYPLYGSVKLDGIRCTIQGGRCMSRTLKPIPNLYCQELFGRESMNGLDGELIVGPPNAPDVCDRTKSGVMSRSGRPDVRFYPFDFYHTQLAFKFRYRHLRENVYPLLGPDSRVSVIGQVQMNSVQELAQFEEEVVGQGFEGVVVRDIYGKYKQGRSTMLEGILTKVKRLMDSEARVLEVVEQMHNANEAKLDALGYMKRSSCKEGLIPAGTLGKLVVQDLSTGVVFNIGTGFNAAIAEEIWKNRSKVVDKLVRYSYLPVGVKDKPRQPRFKGFRDPIDLS